MTKFLVRLGSLSLAFTFFVSSAIIAIIQFIIWIFVKPFSKKLFRKINYFLVYAVFAQLIFIAEWWSGVELILYTDKEAYDKYFGKEHVFCIVNHRYEIDWILTPLLVESLKMLGNYKCYVKKALRYAPGLGWVLSFSENIFLERSFEKDKSNIEKQVSSFSNYEDPIWLTMYPEGTRFTEAKHKASIEFCERNNHSQLNYHLLPRTKGFTTSVPALRRNIPALYDCLIAFRPDEAYQPTLRNILGAKPMKCHMFLERIPFNKIPESEQDLEKFLRDIFQKKDKMMESFVRTGCFFETSGVKKTFSFKKERRLHTLLNEIIMVSVFLCPLLYLVIKNLISGEIIYSCLSISVIATLYFFFNKALSMNDIGNASSYGIKRN